MRKLLFLFLWFMPFLAGAAYQPAMWETFYNQSFTSRNLYSTPLTVGGLKGDTYDYKILLYKKSTGTNSQILLQFNGDTGSNYRFYFLEGGASAVSAGYNNAHTNLLGPYTGTNSSYSVGGIIEISGRSGTERVATYMQSALSSSTTYIDTGAQYWKNTADELTFITLFSNDNTTQDFDLIILRKFKPRAQDSEWELVEPPKILSGTNLSNGVFFSGLDGDRDEEYLLKGCFTTSAADASLSLRFNGDAGNNYALEYFRNQAGTATAYSSTATSVIPLAATASSSQPCVFEARIKAKSGAYRSIFLTSGGGGTYSANGIYASWWKNTADKIEQMHVYIYESNITATGTIELYRRGKGVSASKSAFETLKAVDVDGEFSQGHVFDLAGLGIADADNESMLVLEAFGLTKTASQSNMYINTIFNGDTGNNYTKQKLYASGSTIAAAVLTEGNLHSSFTSDSYPFLYRMFIFPKSGKYRTVLKEVGSYNVAGSNPWISTENVWWLNTADKLTSIKTYAVSANQTQFKGRITLKRLVVK